MSECFTKRISPEYGAAEFKFRCSKLCDVMLMERNILRARRQRSLIRSTRLKRLWHDKCNR